MAQKPPKPADRTSSPRFRQRKPDKRLIDDVSKLRDLARKIPGNLDIYNILLDFSDPSAKPERQDRYIALVSGTLLDHALKTAISKHLISEDKDLLYSIVDDYDRSPLGTFSAKIKIAHALGIVDDTTRNNLDVLRSIRNNFAHSVIEFEFASSECANEINKLVVQPKAFKRFWEHWSPRCKFVTTVFTYYHAIFAYPHERIRNPPVSFV